MRFRGGEFSTGTTGNFQPELTVFFIGLSLAGPLLAAAGSIRAPSANPRGDRPAA